MHEDQSGSISPLFWIVFSPGYRNPSDAPVSDDPGVVTCRNTDGVIAMVTTTSMDSPSADVADRHTEPDTLSVPNSKDITSFSVANTDPIVSEFEPPPEVLSSESEEKIVSEGKINFVVRRQTAVTAYL